MPSVSGTPRFAASESMLDCPELRFWKDKTSRFLFQLAKTGSKVLEWEEPLTFPEEKRKLASFVRTKKNCLKGLQETLRRAERTLERLPDEGASLISKITDSERKRMAQEEFDNFSPTLLGGFDDLSSYYEVLEVRLVELQEQESHLLDPLPVTSQKSEPMRQRQPQAAPQPAENAHLENAEENDQMDSPLTQQPRRSIENDEGESDSDRHTERSEGSEMSFGRAPRHRPKQQLPRFQGDARKFPSFWTAYTAMVHDADDLSDLDKFFYLRQSLREEALRLVEEIPVTAENYPKAVSLLKHRYDLGSSVTTVMIADLQKIRPASESTGSIRETLELLRQKLITLECHGEKFQDVHIWKSLILSKFPPSVNRHIIKEERRLPTTRSGSPKCFAVKELLEEVADYVLLLECIDLNISSITVSQERPGDLQQPLPVSSSPTPSRKEHKKHQQKKNWKCVCQATDHLPQHCPQFTSPSSRRQEAVKHSLCWKCFRTGHHSKDCERLGPCPDCSGDHHRSLCVKNAKETTSTSSSTQGTPAPRKEWTPSKPKTTWSATACAQEHEEPGIPQQEMLSLADPVQLQPAGLQGQIVLTHVTGLLFNEESKEYQPVNVFIDDGAVMSLIRTATSESHALKTSGPYRSLMSGVGGQIVNHSYNLATAKLRSTVYGEADRILQLRTISDICQPLQTAQLSEADWNFIRSQGLQINRSSSPRAEVDILIGQDYRQNFVYEEEPRVRLPSGLLLTKTVFGYAVSGCSTVPPPPSSCVCQQHPFPTGNILPFVGVFTEFSDLQMATPINNKKPLLQAIGRHRGTEDTMNKVKEVVNSRPLCFTSEDSTAEVLRPVDLCQPKLLQTVPPFTNDSKETKLPSEETADKETPKEKEFPARRQPTKEPEVVAVSTGSRLPLSFAWILPIVMCFMVASAAAMTPSGFVACAKGGVLLNIDHQTDIKKPVTAELCVNSRSCTTLLLNKDQMFYVSPIYAIADYKVQWRTLQGSTQVLETVTCPGTPNCDLIDCWICAELVGNPHCWPQAAIFAAALWSYVALATCYFIWRCCFRRCFKDCCRRNLERTAFRLQDLARRRCRARRNSTSTLEETEDLLPLVVVPNREVARRNRLAPSRIVTEFTVVVAITLLILPFADACQRISVVDSSMVQCSEGESLNNSCHAVHTVTASLSELRRDMCIRSVKDNVIQHELKLHFEEVQLYCRPIVQFYTRNVELRTHSVKRCAFAGSCSPSFCSSVSSRTVIPELDNAVSLPGISRCSTSCGGLVCGCALPVPGCLFSRTVAEPVDEDVYVAVTCPIWSTKVALRVEETFHNGTTRSASLRIKEQGIASSPSINDTVDFVANPPLPILSSLFLQKLSNKMDDNTALLAALHYDIALQCPSKESALQPSTCFLRNTCFCSPSINDVHCDCHTLNISRALQSLDSRLPITTSEVALNIQNGLVVAVPHVAVAEVTLVSRFDFNTAVVSTTRCSIVAQPVEGCFNCISGARSTATCTSDLPTVATVTCTDHIFALPCNSSGAETILRLSSAVSTFEDTCVVSCSNSNVSLHGILLFPSLTNDLLAPEEKGHYVNFWNLPEVSNLLAISGSWWKTTILALLLPVAAVGAIVFAGPFIVQMIAFGKLKRS